MWRLGKWDTPGPEIKGDRESSDVGLGACVLCKRYSLLIMSCFFSHLLNLLSCCYSDSFVAVHFIHYSLYHISLFIISVPYLQGIWTFMCLLLPLTFTFVINRSSSPYHLFFNGSDFASGSVLFLTLWRCFLSVAKTLTLCLRPRWDLCRRQTSVLLFLCRIPTGPSSIYWKEHPFMFILS